MKKFCLICLCFFSQFVNVHANDSIRTGDKALLFSVTNESLHPASFMGGLGYSIFLSEKISLRLPLGLEYSGSTIKKPANAESDKITTDLRASIYPGVRFDLGFGKNIIFYAGPQLKFTFHNSVTEGDNFNSNKTTTQEFSWGIGGFIGAEWMPINSLGIALEYQPLLSFSGGTMKYESGGFIQEDKIPSRIYFNLNGSSVLVVLSFYFN